MPHSALPAYRLTLQFALPVWALSGITPGATINGNEIVKMGAGQMNRGFISNQYESPRSRAVDGRGVCT